MNTICIAGKNDIAVDVLLYCIEHCKGCKIVCILCRSDQGINTWQKSLKWFAEKNGIDIYNLDDIYKIENLVFLSLEFDQIIKPDKFRSSRLYNIHFSMLPKYKGMYTSILPILGNETETGVTLHKIKVGIDTGEVIEQKKVKIEQNDTSLDLYKKLIGNGTELVIKNLGRLISGDMDAAPQDKFGSTYYSTSTIDFKNLNLDVKKTAYQIQNQIRAFCFRPYQLMNWKGIQYIECKILDDMSVEKAGTVLEDTEIYTKIATIDYDVFLYKDVFERLLKEIEEGNNELAKKLCISPKIIEAQDSHGWSALTVAVCSNNFEMVQYLVDHSSDLNILDNNGKNLLLYAKDCYVKYKVSDIFEYLLDKGIKMDTLDYYGKGLIEYCRNENISQIGKISLYNLK